MQKADVKFLIIDDLPTIRRLLRSQLHDLGFKNIMDLPDGLNAWNLLSKDGNKSAQIDFIIADWNMPKLTGLELLERLRATSWGVNLPIILLTSESDRELVSAAIMAGVSQYIVKPYTAQNLASKITEAWKKHNSKE